MTKVLIKNGPSLVDVLGEEHVRVVCPGSGPNKEMLARALAYDTDGHRDGRISILLSP
jgi:hypothetical protein